MERKKILKWFGMFLVMMLLFTVLSRAADSMTVARITTTKPQNQVISHVVKGSGKVEGTKERAVFAHENQRVEQVLVQEGQKVAKGDVLLVLSADELEESIVKKQAETDALARKVEDLKSAEAAEETTKSVELARAEENYNVAVSNGDINIANGEMEVNVARQKLQNYYDAGNWDSSREQALLDEIRAREEALNQVIMSRNQEVLEAERAIEDAKAAQASDGSVKNAQQELLEAEQALTKLQETLKSKGKVTAPADGVVKLIAAETGSQTTEEAVAILYELTGELRMTGTITKEDLKYVAPGAEAFVKGSSGKEIENAQVLSIQEDSTDADLRTVSILLPENSLNIGEAVEFSVSVQEGPYSSCVPVSAIYESNGSYYLYVAETGESVLGEVMTARKIEVSVVDKNERLAALTDGAVSGSQMVITDSDREISEGSRVRLQES